MCGGWWGNKDNNTKVQGRNEGANFPGECSEREFKELSKFI